MRQVLKLGVVGAGFVAKFHARALMQVRNMEIAGITSRTAAKAEEVSTMVRANGLGEGIVYSSVAEMANHVDAIAIYTPNFVRVELVEQVVEAVQKGAELKGLICEKPLARNVKEAQRLVDLAKEADLKTAYFENQIFMKPIRTQLAQLEPQQRTMGPLALRLGLDRPLWEQYLNYVWNLAQGDLGVSRFTANTVAFDIRHRLPATFELSTFALLLGIAWTVPLGLLSARYKNSFVDRLAQGLVEAGVAIPSFWLGLLLVYLLFFQFDLFPAPLGRLGPTTKPPPELTGLYTVDSVLAGDWQAFGDALSHLILPAVTLAFTSCPPILQITRNAMVEILRSDYIRAAKSYGVAGPTIYFRYALKNALLPVTTMIAMTYGYLLGGTVLVEAVFAWPGPVCY